MSSVNASPEKLSLDAKCTNHLPHPSWMWPVTAYREISNNRDDIQRDQLTRWEIGFTQTLQVATQTFEDFGLFCQNLAAGYRVLCLQAQCTDTDVSETRIT